LETLEQAGGHYDQALALKPGYARALSGKANILYLLGSGDFSGQEPDPDMLESARERFDAILKLEDPEVADIELNLHFTLGKIHLLQGEAGWEQARKEFEFILERYGQLPDKSLEELAGHTYARLGLLAYYGGDLPEAETLLLAAVERVSPHYQASYLGTLAQMFKNKGDPARAIQLYTRAQDITTFYCEDENAEGYYQAIQTLLGMDAPQE
ncbi:MAG: tetratricopeptide repeat protein, partial [Anaerolineales bacterium]|nr:tetratricopeptide repeat protein [Anaerolineales bacterium]